MCLLLSAATTRQGQHRARPGGIVPGFVGLLEDESGEECPTNEVVYMPPATDGTPSSSAPAMTSMEKIRNLFWISPTLCTTVEIDGLLSMHTCSDWRQGHKCDC
jgi:hypothetical protein